MKDLYWVVPITFKVAGIPDEAVSLGINAECPVCGGGGITRIDHGTKKYRCSLSTGEHAFPKVYVEVDRDKLYLYTESGDKVEYRGTIHKVDH